MENREDKYTNGIFQIGEKMDQRTIDFWNSVLEINGYVSLIPIEEYFSNDMTEAWIMLDFWVTDGIIVPNCYWGA